MDEATFPRETGHVGAFLGGLLGAAAGAAVWAVFVLGFHIYWGAIAFLVGLAAGFGARLLAGKHGSTAARPIACVCAVVGYLAGMYMIKGHLHANWVEAKEGIRPALLDPRVWKYVWGNPDHHFGFFDLLWGAFAIWGASIVPSTAPRRPAEPAA